MTKRIREMSDNELFKDMESAVWDLVFSCTELNKSETGLAPYFTEMKRRFPIFQGAHNEDDDQEDDDEDEDEEDDPDVNKKSEDVNKKSEDK